MYRGTTPTNVFTVDVDLTDAEVLYVTYKQGSRVAFEKSKSGVIVEADRLTVTLSQIETLSLSPGDVDIQIRARFGNGSAIASNVIHTTANAVLKDGVI